MLRTFAYIALLGGYAAALYDFARISPQPSSRDTILFTAFWAATTSCFIAEWIRRRANSR
ncbi:MAG TPA: hypothetical protein VG055_04405 [Planctomycetaceae bacterium]|nr:hypothetical protein [Planctomycetaceae bacterium]